MVEAEGSGITWIQVEGGVPESGKYAIKWTLEYSQAKDIRFWTTEAIIGVYGSGWRLLDEIRRGLKDEGGKISGTLYADLEDKFWVKVDTKSVNLAGVRLDPHETWNFKLQAEVRKVSKAEAALGEIYNFLRQGVGVLVLMIFAGLLAWGGWKLFRKYVRR